MPLSLSIWCLRRRLLLFGFSQQRNSGVFSHSQGPGADQQVAEQVPEEVPEQSCGAGSKREESGATRQPPPQNTSSSELQHEERPPPFPMSPNCRVTAGITCGAGSPANSEQVWEQVPEQVPERITEKVPRDLALNLLSQQINANALRSICLTFSYASSVMF